MSYDIRIWEHPSHRPTPTSREEVGRIMLELEKTKPGVNPKFVALAQKMIECHTYSDMYPSGDRAAADATWLGNPVRVAKEWEKGVWGVELPSEDTVGILRFMVDSATGLGLTVFDEQIGMAFLPGGVVLPQQQRAMWDGLKVEMASAPARKTTAQVRKAIVAKVTPIMLRNGFEPRKSRDRDFEFFRMVEGGASQVFGGTVIARRYGQFDMSSASRGYDQRISNIVEAACDANVMKLNALKNFCEDPTIFFWSLEGVNVSPGGVSAPINSDDQIQNILVALEEKLIPVLDLARSLRGLDELLNGDVLMKRTKEREWECSPSPLIVARLAGQRDFEKYAQDYLAFLSALPPRFQSQLPIAKQLIPYLREHVKPVA